jgi:hypothetical protein
VSLERYSELLSESDFEVLLRVARSNATFSRLRFERIRDDPELLDYLLGSDDLYSVLFTSEGDPFIQVSPFLGFAVLMHQGAVAISGATFVTEWIGPKKRVPLFDTSKPKEVLQDPGGRLFLAELLASFTHISSGVAVYKAPEGIKRRRFSEIDLSSLVEVAAAVEDFRKLQVIKRIGDLSLLLAGVFPDYAGSMIDKSPRFRGAVSRALSETGARSIQAERFENTEILSLSELPGLRILDELASSCYSYVLRSNIGHTQGIAGTLQRVATDSEAVRRALNFVSDRYLFEYRSSWFGLPN